MGSESSGQMSTYSVQPSMHSDASMGHRDAGSFLSWGCGLGEPAVSAEIEEMN